jgi:hypothetical protein
MKSYIACKSHVSSLNSKSVCLIVSFSVTNSSFNVCHILSRSVPHNTASTRMNLILDSRICNVRELHKLSVPYTHTHTHTRTHTHTHTHTCVCVCVCVCVCGSKFDASADSSYCAHSFSRPLYRQPWR